MGTLSSRAFRGLLATQFCGALNDNLFKTALSLLVVHRFSVGHDPSYYLAMAQLVFTLPFLVFAPYAGFIADRFSKTLVVRWTRVFEIVIMTFALYLFHLMHLSGLLLMLFLIGVHSTVFSPAKYGMLPEVLDDAHLSKGNGYLQLGTFVAIIIGTALAGTLTGYSGILEMLPAMVMLLVSLGGFLISFSIPHLAPASQAARFEINPFRQLIATLGDIRKNRSIKLTVYATTFFWFIGALVQSNTILYAKTALGVDELKSSLLLALLGMGIGIGSVTAGRVSEGKVELGLVPIGALGMSLALIALDISSSSYVGASFTLFALGFFAGMYIVPLTAFLQRQSPAAERGRYLSTAGFLNSAGIVAASSVLWLTQSVLNIEADDLFLLMGILTFVTGIYIVRMLPEILVRCVNWTLAHTLYRIKVLGIENVPSQGGALIVCNHVSYIDAQLLLAGVERPVRFIMHRPIYESKLINPVARATKAIPISGADGKEGVLRSLAEAAAALRNGELVGIFAEGGISRTGVLLPFKSGLETIMHAADVPIIPAHIDRLWGSIFSFRGGKFLWKKPKRIPYPITISFGAALRSNAKAFEVREKVQELSAQAFDQRDALSTVLPLAFLEQVRSTPARIVVEGSDGVSWSYLRLLSGARLCWRELQSGIRAGDRVGLDLSDWQESLLLNLALCLGGAVAVNLPKGSSAEFVERCGLSTVIISSNTLRPADTKAQVIVASDIIARPCLIDSLWVLFALLLLPRSLAAKLLISYRSSSTDCAAVVFTRGRSAPRRAVMLSHRNITAVVEGIYDLLQFDQRDVIAGILPFSHAYGLVTNLWLPVLSGGKVVYFGGDGGAALQAVALGKRGITVLFDRSANLPVFLRQWRKEDLGSLNRVVVGGDKLEPDVVRSFEEALGVEVLEGYGSSEISSVALLNVPDYGSGERRQVGRKIGSVGVPLPGVAIRIMDRGTKKPVVPGEKGVLAMRGAGLMLGYLDSQGNHGDHLMDGWFVTDDEARIDPDGFVELC